jgi:hypothetical protein
MTRKGERRVVIPIAVVLVVVGVVLVGYYFITKRESTVAEYKTYINEKYSYKLDYPSNWYTSKEITGERTIPNPLLDSFTAYNSSDVSRLADVIIFLQVYDKTLAENQYGISLDNLTKYILSLENMLGNELIYKPIGFTIDNYYGVTFSYQQEGNIARYQEEQVVRDNYLYWLTMLVAPGKNYPTYEQIFQHVIASFTF